MPDHVHPDFFQRIREVLQKGFFFTTFRLPGRHYYHLLVQTNTSVLPFHDPANLPTPGFAMYPFDTGSAPSVWLQADVCVRSDKYAEVPLSPKAPAYDAAFKEAPGQSLSKDEYLRRTVMLINEMKTGTLEKVVFSRRIAIEDNGVDLVSTFQRLADNNPAAFVYMIHLPGGSTWMGATPETLLTVNHRMMRTVALAGTMATNPEKKAVWGKKELYEHTLVSSEIISTLNDLQLPYQKSGPHTRVVNSDMTHLCTEFRIPQKEMADMQNLLDRLHPTPAVSGTPRIEAMKRILETEAYERQYYTGYLGPLFSIEEAHFFVNLRCASFSPRGSFMYSGGGLTADSDPLAEWEETELKSRTIRRSLAHP